MNIEEFSLPLTRLIAALVAGAIIGLERSYNGRPAGFRTHSLVCMSSSLLMLLTVYQWSLLEGAPLDTIRVDPTRMAQGIMTGIGFLGAGVIMKEGATIRGLTTAASIWVTASIGILIGIGFYTAAISATALALGVLSLFRWFENKLPTMEFAKLSIRVPVQSGLTEDKIVDFARGKNVRTGVFSYFFEQDGKFLRFEVLLASRHPDNFRHLANLLYTTNGVSEFQIVPRGN